MADRERSVVREDTARTLLRAGADRTRPKDGQPVPKGQKWSLVGTRVLNTHAFLRPVGGGVSSRLLGSKGRRRRLN